MCPVMIITIYFEADHKKNGFGPKKHPQNLGHGAIVLYKQHIVHCMAPIAKNYGIANHNISKRFAVGCYFERAPTNLVDFFDKQF